MISLINSQAFTDTTITGTSLVCTYAVNVGDCVYISLAANANNIVAPTVTDTGGNTYTQQLTPGARSPTHTIFTTIAIAAATSITVTYPSGVVHAVNIASYAGVSSIGINKSIVISPTNTTPPSISGSLASTASWAVISMTQSGNVAISSFSGATQRLNTTSTASLRVSTYDTTGTTSLAFSAILASSSNWVVSFIELIATPSVVNFKKAITPVLNNTTTTITLAYSIAIGDFVIVYTALNTAQSLSFTVTDDGGNHYSPGPLTLPAGGLAALSFFVTNATTTATTITITVSSQPTNSWTAGAVTYTNVNAVGNTGNFNNNTANTVKSIVGTMHSASTLMSAMLTCRSVTSITAVSGNLRASNPATTALGIMDNIGSINPTCSYSTPQAGIWSALFIELIAAPNLTAISPASGNTGTTVPITLTGTGLTNANSLNISGSGITFSNLVATSDTTVTANLIISTTAAAGSRTISITSIPGGTSNVVNFSVQLTVPVLSSITPNTMPVGSTISVVLSGTGLSGTTAINVSGTGFTITNLTVVNDNTVTATFFVTPLTLANIRTISVTTPGGISNTLNFTLTRGTFFRNRAVIKYGFTRRRFGR